MITGLCVHRFVVINTDVRIAQQFFEVPATIPCHLPGVGRNSQSQFMLPCASAAALPDVDEFSDSLSCDSDLYFFEGCHDNSSEAESSCVESDFQTLSQSNSNAMRARVERAQAPNMYVHNPDVQMLCRIDEFADVDVDAHSDDSFCTCNSEIC